MIELEELQAMTDTELNEMAAVKVMGWKYRISKHGHYIVESPHGTRFEPNYASPKFDEQTGEKIEYSWSDGVDIPRPTTDMNDAMLLFEQMVQESKYSDATITYPWCVVASWNPMAEDAEWRIRVEDDSLPRAITIASILALE
jgi:hypothetical protein